MKEKGGGRGYIQEKKSMKGKGGERRKFRNIKA
jgi:hypothetical protein